MKMGEKNPYSVVAISRGGEAAIDYNGGLFRR